MAKISTKGMRPGAQMPQKYPSVGPNYQQWGEVPGYVYIPSRDEYYENPKELQKQLEAQGAIDPEPKPPGLLEQVGPIAGGAAALYAGKELGQGLFNKETLQGGYDAAKEALGFGGPASTTAPVASSVATPSGMFTSGAEAVSTQAPFEVGTAAGGGTMMSDGSVAGTPTGMFSPGTMGGNLLGGAGVALGGWQAYEGIKNKNPLQAGLGGAGVAGGLGMLGYGLGPVGWGVAIGVPLLASLAGGIGDKDMWKTEGNRLGALREKGLSTIPQPENLVRGRSKDELVAIEEEKIKQGLHGNPEFARTRDESLLNPLDTWGAAANWELLGDDYITKSSEEQRKAFQQSLINQGLWEEKHGSLYIKDKDKAKAAWEGVTGQKVAASEAKGPEEKAVADVQVAPTRSKTRSPGIDLEGNRISY